MEREQPEHPTLDHLKHVGAFLGRQILKEPIPASSDHYKAPEPDTEAVVCAKRLHPSGWTSEGEWVNMPDDAA